MSKENLSIESGSMSVVGEELFKLVEKVENDPTNERIDPADFIDHTAIISGREVNLFPKTEVDADNKRVQQKKEDLIRKHQADDSGNRETEIKAALLESMLPQLIRELSWFSDRVKVINSSLYDDYFNGIDGAIQLLPNKEIKDERDLRCVGFSIDFTLSLEQSHEKIFNQALFLCRGVIPRMKYFKTDILTPNGLKSIKLKDFKMPKIVLACSNKIIDDSIDDLIEYEENNGQEAKDRLTDCDLKYYFIRETISQLTFFIDLVEKLIVLEEKDGNDSILISKYNRILDIYDNSMGQFIDIIKGLGYDGETVRNRIKHIPSPTDKFDLNTKEGDQIVNIIRLMAKGN